MKNATCFLSSFLRAIPRALVAVVTLSAFAPAAAQDYVVLHSFNVFNPDGTGSEEGGSPFVLIQGSDGNFYGATYVGGNPDFTGDGKVFRMTPDGTITVLPNIPRGPLIQGRDGNLYVSVGRGNGAIVKSDLDGSHVTTLHSFTGPDGAAPGELVEARDGSFYGIAGYGGEFGNGTVFRITADGSFTVLHSFEDSDVESPVSPLVQAADGNLYGVSYSGGLGGGNIFKITTDGFFSVLHNFTGFNGEGVSPVTALTEGGDGRLYGTTLGGGDFGYGTAFRIERNGEVSTLHSFSLSPENTAGPIGRLLRASDGHLWGTTGYTGLPTIYRMAPDGSVTFEHFSTGKDGFAPMSLIHGRDGNFYGAAQHGGAHGDGVVFRFRNPSACDDAMDATLNNGTLTLNFTLKTNTPALWSAWALTSDRFVPLWLLPLPVVSPAAFLSVPIPGVVDVGSIVIGTHLFNQALALCASWRVIDTNSGARGTLQ